MNYLKCWTIPYKVEFHATDQEEADFIRSYFGEPAKVFIAGNFPTKVGLLPLPFKEPGKLKLVSVGIISPMKNYFVGIGGVTKIDRPY